LAATDALERFPENTYSSRRERRVSALARERVVRKRWVVNLSARSASRGGKVPGVTGVIVRTDMVSEDPDESRETSPTWSPSGNVPLLQVT
jgi:hypothetical protein